MGTSSAATRFRFDPKTATMPTRDGEVLEFVHPEAKAATGQFQPNRRIVFINGMATPPAGHAESAMALSLVQMCPVTGIYNATADYGYAVTRFAADLAQCLGDKLQFNGPLNPGARTLTTLGPMLTGNSREQLIASALKRNPAAVATFQLLREPQRRTAEIFAHSQGNLILSNALQAIAALDGVKAITGFTVHTFGSPAANWPQGLRRREHAFTWDPVSWLAGLDTSLSISKVGMPSDSFQPITHAFLEYMASDPVFVVNRFRTGSLGITFDMDEAGLAECLVAMGANVPRVRRVFEHLAANHPSDVDDVAELYVEGVQKDRERPAIESALRADPQLRNLLIQAMAKGWTSGGEHRAIGYLRSLGG